MVWEIWSGEKFHGLRNMKRRNVTKEQILSDSGRRSGKCRQTGRQRNCSCWSRQQIERLTWMLHGQHGNISFTKQCYANWIPAVIIQRLTLRWLGISCSWCDFCDALDADAGNPEEAQGQWTPIPPLLNSVPLRCSATITTSLTILGGTTGDTLDCLPQTYW